MRSAALDTRIRRARGADRLALGRQPAEDVHRPLARRPDSQVLLLDDPAKGVDLAAKADFFALARGLAGKGVGIIFYASEDAELLVALRPDPRLQQRRDHRGELSRRRRSPAST